MLTLYWSPRSSAIRALWMLEELGVPHNLKEIDIQAEPRRDPDDFLAASPIGKVPALRDGEELLSGSAAICLYLADRYASGRLAPAPTDDGRADYLYWLLFTPVSIEPAMAEKFMNLTPNKAAAPWGTWDLMMDTLEKGVAARPFIAGEDFSAADVMIASSCRFLKQFGLATPSPAMANYMERCMARPAYRLAEARSEAG